MNFSAIMPTGQWSSEDNLTVSQSTLFSDAFSFVRGLPLQSFGHHEAAVALFTN